MADPRPSVTAPYPAQLDIFSAPPTHTIDPATSRAAAKKAAGGAQAHRERILLLLARMGDHGATAYECWLATGGVRHSSGTRLKEMKDRKDGGPALVEQHHDRTRPTDTGSPACVWTLTAEGRRVAAQLQEGRAA